MSQIEVPDWVVEIATEAYSALPARTTFHDSMKASIRAALEGWLVHEGWKYEGIYSSVPPFRKDRADGYTSPLYTIRKEPAA